MEQYYLKTKPQSKRFRTFFIFLQRIFLPSGINILLLSPYPALTYLYIFCMYVLYIYTRIPVASSSLQYAMRNILRKFPGIFCGPWKLFLFAVCWGGFFAALVFLEEGGQVIRLLNAKYVLTYIVTLLPYHQRPSKFFFVNCHTILARHYVKLQGLDRKSSSYVTLLEA